MPNNRKETEVQRAAELRQIEGYIIGIDLGGSEK